MGGDFLLDGKPLSGLNSVGDSIQVEVSESSVLSGTLSDGSVFIVTQMKHEYNERDYLSDGTINLVVTSLPTVDPVINLPTDPAPRQIGSGQVLNMSDGGLLPDRFTAVNSTMNLDGGTIGNLAEVAKTEVNLNGAEIGDYFHVMAQSTITINSGSIGEHFTVIAGSTLNMTGGSVANSMYLGNTNGLDSGVTANISGGSIGSLNVYGNNTLNLSGGTIVNGLGVAAGANVNISGGLIDGRFDARTESTVRITGGIVEGSLRVYEGSDVKILGESVIGSVTVFEDADLDIEGGEVGYLYIESGAVVDISGGQVINQSQIDSFATLNLSGGESGNIWGDSYSTLNIFGSSFILDGVDLTPQLTPDQPFTIHNRNVTLEGILVDGTPFSYNLNTAGFPFFTDVLPYDMLLTVNLCALPGDLNLDGFVGLDDLMIVLEHWLEDVTPGDLMMGDPSGDGYVFLEDLDTVLINWNKGIPPILINSNAGRVPEPTALALFGIGFVALLRRRN